ncbi:MAG: response regulator [Candidatus Marinimicrobia bacterium]|nr:response regulator [Candidatus Neomarinimicrobiota bacterium]
MENKKTILFFEDEERLQKIIAAALESAGYNVLNASDGELGIKILGEESPDLILLDLILPKKDGFEVLEYLKTDKKLQKIPVVVSTNLEDKHDIERAMSYGVRAYLVKANYRPEEIVEKIREILEEKTKNNEN